MTGIRAYSLMQLNLVNQLLETSGLKLGRSEHGWLRMVQVRAVRNQMDQSGVGKNLVGKKKNEPDQGRVRQCGPALGEVRQSSQVLSEGVAQMEDKSSRWYLSTLNLHFNIRVGAAECMHEK